LRKYNIPNTQTVIRGSLRHAGFQEFINSFLGEKKQISLKEPIAWKAATKKILGATVVHQVTTIYCGQSRPKRPSKIPMVAGLKWLGIFSESKITPKGNPLYTLCATLEEKMAFEADERDFVVSIIFIP